MKQVIRIIGGQHRGRKLHFPESLNLRPTPNRIRETLFNWLMQTVRGAHCLDTFSGSGALGFEAASRGAAHVTLLETVPLVIKNLQKQAELFKNTPIEIIQTNALHYLEHTKKTFDIIFLDPPFNNPSLLNKSIALIEAHALLTPKGIMYTESPKPISLNQAAFKTLKEKKSGLVYYALHQKRAVSEATT